MSGRRGFTLIEIVVALVIFGVVSASIYQVLLGSQRIFGEQSERVAVNDDLRAGVSFLTSELRELNAGDPADSDILGMSASSVTYKAMRSLYFLCQAPNVAAGTVTVSATSWGVRELDAALDSVVIYADGDQSSTTDDQWIHANVRNLATGTACPGGAASVTITLDGITAPGLASVVDGAPLRGFEVHRLSSVMVSGAPWLGREIYRKTSGAWSSEEALVGPLTTKGLTLTYYDSLGTATADRTRVARIGIVIEAESERIVDRGADFEKLDASVNTQVALRNNPRS